MGKNNAVVMGEIPTAAAAAEESVDRQLYLPPLPHRRGDDKAGIRVYRKLPAPLELNGDGGGRISSWVDSMRASSPTHDNYACALGSSDASEDRRSWNARHPSALNMFREIVERSKGKQIVMFLDYDGTLTPIVEDPIEHSCLNRSMREAVREVAKCFPTAIVTGRCRDKVYQFVRIAELFYAGSHGMDIKGPANVFKHLKPNVKPILFQPASESLPTIFEVYKALVEKTKSIPGAKVENNKFCVSVHYRCVDEKEWSLLAEQVRSVLKEYPRLRLTQGRKVLEIRPMIKWDKGKALEFILKSLGFAENTDVLPIYIGDDRTDEDAFKVLRERGQGFGILVTKIPKVTNATYSLQEPAEVKEFLRRLVEWKREPDSSSY